MPTITNTSIVRLPDGTVGEACWVSADEAVIVHGDKPLGRGPWYFAVDQLELASPADAEAYRTRCAELRARAA